MTPQDNTKKILLIPTGSFRTLSKFVYILLLIIPLTKSFSDENSPAMVSLGIGSFNVVRPQRTMQYQIEYKWAASWHHIQPFTSLFATNHGSVYWCFGACADLFITKKIVLIPGFAPGIYFKGKGKDLGYPLEFRSSVALAYQFKNKDRIGVQFYHISNASLGRRNPGSESLIFYYGIALK